MELKRVVVTGLGAITPLGNNVPSTWAALLEGVSGAGPITLFDASEFKTQFACQVKDFDPLKYFNAKEVRKLDRYTQFALAATQEGIADSGLDLETVIKIVPALSSRQVSAESARLSKKSGIMPSLPKKGLGSTRSLSRK